MERLERGPIPPASAPTADATCRTSGRRKPTRQWRGKPATINTEVIMSRTYRENDQSETKARYQRRHNKRHMVEVLRFSMGRYIDANARANVDRSAKWFAAVDRAGRIVGSLDQLG